MIQFDYSSIDLEYVKGNLILSSVLGEDNFFYGLYQQGPLRLLSARFISDLPKGFYHDPAAWEHLFNQNKLSQLPVERMFLAMASPHFTLVPRESDFTKKSILRAMDDKAYDNDYDVQAEALDDISSDFHFLYPAKSFSWLSSRLPFVKITHLNAALILSAPRCKGNCLVLNFYSNSFQTLVFRDGKLLQTNHYELKGKDDALYFAALHYERYGFNPAEDPVFLSGHIYENAPQWNTLHEHFNYVEFPENKDRLHYANVFLGKPKRLFYNLDCVLACGS